MKNKYYYILGLLVLFFLSIKILYPNKSFEGILWSEVYLCPNGEDVLFVYEKDKASSFFRFKIGTNIAIPFIKKEGWYLCEPSFSEDGEKLIYRAFKANSSLTSIFIANIDGSNPTEIYKDSLLFTPKFSKYNQNEIFFVKASEYSNHSPIATPHPNGMDLYSYNLYTKKGKKLTNDNYYGISSYFFVDNNHFVINCDLTGIFKYSMFDFKKKKLIIEGKIDSLNIDQIYNNNMSYSEVEKNYLLSTNFEAYLYNENDLKLKTIYTSEAGNPIGNTLFFKNEKKIFIVDSNNIISIVDFNGNVLNNIHIPLPR